MRLFLVDLENVQSYGIEGCEHLKSKDKIIIFYSKNANQLMIPHVLKIVNSQASVKFYETIVGSKNALDFQLVFQLGMVAGHFRGKELIAYIISNDKGFDCISDYVSKILKIENIQVYRASSIKTVLEMEESLQNTFIPEKEETIDDFFYSFDNLFETQDKNVSDASDTVKKEEFKENLKSKVRMIAKSNGINELLLEKIFTGHSTTNEFHNALLHYYSNNKVKNLYKELKNLFVEYHKWN